MKIAKKKKQREEKLQGKEEEDNDDDDENNKEGHVGRRRDPFPFLLQKTLKKCYHVQYIPLHQKNTLTNLKNIIYDTPLIDAFDRVLIFCFLYFSFIGAQTDN